jgi:hypothetical protein
MSTSLTDPPHPGDGTENTAIKVLNWQDEIDPIQDSTTLIRYIRLEGVPVALIAEFGFHPPEMRGLRTGRKTTRERTDRTSRGHH